MRLLHVNSPMNLDCCSQTCLKQLGSLEMHCVEVKTDLGIESSLNNLKDYAPLYSSTMSHKRCKEVCLATQTTKAKEVGTEMEVVKSSFRIWLFFLFDSIHSRGSDLRHLYLRETIAFSTVE